MSLLLMQSHLDCLVSPNNTFESNKPKLDQLKSDQQTNMQSQGEKETNSLAQIASGPGIWVLRNQFSFLDKMGTLGLNSEVQSFWVLPN